MMQAPPPPDARRRVPDVVQQLVQQHRADQRKKLEDVLRRNRSSNQASPRLAALLPTTAPTTWRATTPASSPPRWASFAATVALPEDLGDGWRAGLERYKGEAADMCRRYYTVWVPANMLVFTVVPVPLRIGFIATTSFGWLTAASFFTHQH